MQSDKHLPTTLTNIQDYKRELDYLYSRRSAIDAVITSLEEYDRHRAVASVYMRERKTA